MRLESQLPLGVPPNARNAARLAGRGGTSARHWTLVGPRQVIVSRGAPGACAAKSDQKPPTSEKLPPVIGGALASGWPIVPLMENAPPVLVPPRPADRESGVEGKRAE